MTQDHGASASADQAVRERLLSLADRCEAAAGPVPVLDADIGEAVLGSDLAFIKVQMPRYTASLDAAMTLVSGDAFWRLGHDGDGADPSEFRAQIIVPKLGGADARGNAVAFTPALALCAAALRAQAGEP